MSAFFVMRLELLIARRNLWVATAIVLMSLFSVVLTLAGSTPTGTLGADPLRVALGSITTLSVYLIPLIALLLSFDAIAGETERGTLALGLTYPLARLEILLGKFLAHLAVLAIAVATGLGLSAALVLWQYGGQDISLAPLLRLFLTSLALGAAFLGMGYMVSSLARSPSVASGVVIAIWLISVVLYDLGLLAGLVADQDGVFSQKIFPWLLIANPADAFRLLNLPDVSPDMLTSGLTVASVATGPVSQFASLLGWPVLALLLAWAALQRLEP